MSENLKTVILLSASFVCFWVGMGSIAGTKHEKNCYKHSKNGKSDILFSIFGPLSYVPLIRKKFICNN